MDLLKAAPPQESRLHFLDYWRIIRIRKTVILAVFLLVAITATIVTFILPPLYSSTARVKITRDQSDIPDLTGERQNFVYDAYFIQTEFEVMKSRDVLARVINDLDLNKVWGKKYGGPDSVWKMDQTIANLRGSLRLQTVRNTLLIDITAYSSTPQEAADIANALAVAYKENRKVESQNLAGGGLEALKEEKAEQQKKIEEASAEVEQLRQQLKIADPQSASSSLAPTLDYEVVAQIQNVLNDYEVKFAELATALTNLQGLSRKELRAVLPRAMATPDTQLMSLLGDLNTAEQRLLFISRDYAKDHPIYKNAEEAVTDLNKKVDECVDGILIGMQHRAEDFKAVMDVQKAKLENAKQSDIARAQETRPYYRAKDKLQLLQDSARLLDMKIFQTRVDTSIPKTAAVSIVERAQVDTDPVRPKKGLNIALGIIIGLVVGVGLAFFIEYLDTSVKTIDDVERALQAPVLGVIPQNVGVLLNEGAESPHAEAYRVLRTNLLFSRKDEKLNTICAVSAGAGEGKSTTILNLATVFAQSGHRVLLVDSDLRRPTLHKMLKLNNNLGLTNCLLKQNSLEEVIQRTTLPTLDLLPSGKLPSSSLSILSSAQMRELITELKRRYDFVFFDSPPIMGVSDASVLASEVDLTVQVIQYRRYPQPMNIRAKQMVEKVGGNLIGIVLNNINMSQDESYYYYSGYYHGYYYSREEDQTPADEVGAGSAPGDKPLEIKQKY